MQESAASLVASGGAQCGAKRDHLCEHHKGGSRSVAMTGRSVAEAGRSVAKTDGCSAEIDKEIVAESRYGKSIPCSSGCVRDVELERSITLLPPSVCASVGAWRHRVDWRLAQSETRLLVRVKNCFRWRHHVCEVRHQFSPASDTHSG